MPLPSLQLFSKGVVMNNFEKLFFWRLFGVMITTAILLFYGCSDGPSTSLQPVGDVIVNVIEYAGWNV